MTSPGQPPPRPPYPPATTTEPAAPEKDIFAWPLPQSSNPIQTPPPPPPLPTTAQPQSPGTEKEPSSETWPTLQRDIRMDTSEHQLPQRSKRLRQTLNTNFQDGETRPSVDE